jgi:HAD superfamily hydrolase (TIGR01549 family)
MNASRSAALVSGLSKLDREIGSFRESRGILFDFGGTLDSDGEHWLDRFFLLYKRCGLDIPPPEIKRVFYRADALCCSDPRVTSMGLRALMAHHVRLQFHGLNLEDDAREKELVEAFCVKSERHLRRNAGLLSGLTGSYRLGLVSNFYGNVAVLCEEAGLAHSLNVILDSTRVGIGKPNPEIFQLALANLELAATQVIFVGDSFERDMIPARELGMRTIWLKGPNPRVPPNAGPVDACISSLTELDALV